MAAVRAGGGVGRIDLTGVVTAAVQAPDLVVGHVGDHRLEFGELAKEILARVGAALGLEVLVLTVDALFHDATQQPQVVFREQRIPTRAPQYLDDVPTGTEEGCLQLLDDLAVAAHRAVEPLQVAVDDEHQVVELLAHRHGERAHRFRLVHLAVAQERPYLAVAHRDETAVLQITLEARLEDRLHGTEAHGDRRELPEVRHEPRVRIGGEPVTGDFLPEMAQLLLGQASFEVGPRVDTGRGVALDEQHVTGMLIRGGAPEVVEPHLVENRG